MRRVPTTSLVGAELGAADDAAAGCATTGDSFCGASVEAGSGFATAAVGTGAGTFSADGADFVAAGAVEALAAVGTSGFAAGRTASAWGALGTGFRD